MRKSIIFAIASFMMLVAMAQQTASNIILVKPTGDWSETRHQLQVLFGQQLKMQLNSTTEMVIITNESLDVAKKKIQKVLPQVSIRQVNTTEFEVLKGDQLKGR
ncbi:MAG: hypothetical protein JNK66_07385 [Chitinophagales bacterium]|nr:hypothetical protein [Chitinophagales bacterium]